MVELVASGVEKKGSKGEKQMRPIFLKKYTEIDNYKFDQYKECGTKVDLSFAIDFTISNGNFKKGEPSLHSMDPRSNLYSKVMIAIGNQFESLQRKMNVINLLGFGCKGTLPHNHTMTVHNLDLMNQMAGVDGAVSCYLQWLPSITLAGPTFYREVMDQINKRQVDHELYYKVLVIVTDGEPNDLQDTIDQIVISSFKPISYIIISVSHMIKDYAHYGHLEARFDKLEQLASNIQYSKKFDLY